MEITESISYEWRLDPETRRRIAYEVKKEKTPQAVQNHRLNIKTHEECEAVLSRIIEFYNNERPHMSVGMQTLAEAHTQYGQQRRCWKNGWVVA